MKRVLTIVSLVGLIFGLGQATAQDEQVTELRYFFRITQPAMERNINWLIDTFNERNDDINIVGRGVDGETYKTLITTELRSPNPPDVFFSWEGGFAQDLIDAGLAANLDAFYEEFGWEEFLNPAGVSLATYNGSKYFLPTEMAASVVWYRTDIFEEHGLTPPATWDELLELADVLQANDIAPFMLANQQRWPAQFIWTALLVNRHGLEAYEELLANRIPWTDEQVVDTFAFMRQMVEDGLFIDAFNALDVTPAVVPFGQGDAAMWYQGSFMLGRFRGDLDMCCLFPLDFFAFPRFGNVDPVVSVFVEDTLMIHAGSDKKDAAARFLDFVVSTEAQQMKIEIDKPFPANLNVDLSELSPIEQRLGAVMAEAGGFTFMHVDHAFSPAIADVFLDVLQGVLVGAIPPDQAAADTERAAERVRGPVN